MSERQSGGDQGGLMTNKYRRAMEILMGYKSFADKDPIAQLRKTVSGDTHVRIPLDIWKQAVDALKDEGESEDRE